MISRKEHRFLLFSQFPKDLDFSQDFSKALGRHSSQELQVEMPKFKFNKETKYKKSWPEGGDIGIPMVDSC